MQLRLTMTVLGITVLASPALCVAEDIVKTGPHFRVVCHFNDEQIAASALATAEAVWPVGAGLYGISSEPLDKLLEVHLYKNPDAYRKADQEITGGEFQQNLAFAHHETKSAHIAIQPFCPDVLLEEIGLPFQTRHLIAHEVAHLVRFHAFFNYKSHPDWLADGAAIYLSEAALIAKKWSPGRDDDPYISTDHMRTKRLTESGKLPRVEDLFRDEVNDLSFYDRYAVRSTLFRFMKEGPYSADLEAVLAEARRIGGGEGYAKKLHGFLESRFGSERFSKLNQDFRSYVENLSPQWDEVHRSLETAGNEWIQVAWPGKNALAWRTKPVGKETYAIRGAVKMLPAANSQMNLLLARSDAGFISIALVADYGATVFHYHAKDNHWERLGSAEVAGCGLGKKVRFRAEVKEAQLTVSIQGKKALEVPLGKRSMTGPWGLGAQSGSAGIWFKVQD